MSRYGEVSIYVALSARSVRGPTTTGQSGLYYLPIFLPLSFTNRDLIPTGTFAGLFSSSPYFVRTRVFGALAVTPHVDSVGPTVFSLGRTKVFMATIISIIPQASGTLTIFSSAPPKPNFSSILKGNRCSEATLIKPSNTLKLIVRNSIVMCGTSYTTLGASYNGTYIIITRRDELQRTPNLTIVVKFQAMGVIDETTTRRTSRVSKEGLRSVTICTPTTTKRRSTTPNFTLII